MKTLPIIALCLLTASTAWAGGATTKTGTAGTATGTTGAVEGGVIGPYGYQPYLPNEVGAYGSVPTIGPVAPVGPAENTPITTAPPPGDAAQAGGAPATHVQSVYSDDCYADAQGHSVHKLISWGCHAADGTEVSAGECQAPPMVTPCN